MLICVGVFETWSSPRITCVIPSSMSSTGRGEVVGRAAVGADDHEVGRAARSGTRSGRGPRRPSATTPSSGMPEADRALVLVGLALVDELLARARAPRRAVSSWNVTGPSQSIPSQRSDSWICSVASATSRLVSVFSIRSRHSPPCWRANSQLKRNVRTPPMWRKPVGLGAMRTRTLIVVSIVGRRWSSGRTSPSSGGIDTAIDRIEAIGGDCVQVFTQSPRMWRPTDHKPEAIERFKARRAEAGIGGVVCHALYLVQPRGAGRRDLREVDRRRCARRVDAAAAIEADAVIFHVGSHLGAGLRRRRSTASSRRSSRSSTRCDGDTWLLMENSAGPGGTIGRSLGELADAASTRLDRHPRLGICLDSCHLYASGYDVTDPAAVDELVAEVDDDDRPRPAARAARQRQRDAARLEPRPAREHPRGRDRRGPRRLPRPPGLPGARRLPRGAGRRSDGPDADEIAEAARAARALDASRRGQTPGQTPVDARNV